MQIVREWMNEKISKQRNNVLSISIHKEKKEEMLKRKVAKES